MDAFYGYSHKNGRVGVRNHVLVISLVGCVSEIARHIAWKTGTHPICHEKGCLEPATGLDETRRAIRGAALNPNTGAVLFISNGCEQVRTEDFESALKKESIPYDVVNVQASGGALEAESLGIEKISQLKKLADASAQTKQPASNLTVGVQCGGSDWTTALVANPVIGVMADLVVQQGGTILMSEVNGFSGSEFMVARNAVNRIVGLQVLDMVDELRESYYKRTGQRIEEANPTPGNKAGGITTLAEKSMGNIKKMGGSPVQGILRLGEKIPHGGVWILDQRTIGPDHYVTTGFAMMGANITVFSSGRGTPAGSALMPVIKITGNTESYKRTQSAGKRLCFVSFFA